VARARGWIEDDAVQIKPTEVGRRFTNDVVSLFLDPEPPAGAGAD
jgi:oxygen-independent coproporphyrinogen-3 oxidase